MIDQRSPSKPNQVMVMTQKRIKVLMVCTGNICRSPTAEGLLRHHLREAGLEDRVEVASAAMEDYHIGQSPSHEAVVLAAARGYDISQLRARRLTREDFMECDLILAMDEGHLDRLTALKPANATCAIALFLDVLPGSDLREVADPYYGTSADYEAMLDTIEATTPFWVEALQCDYLTSDGSRF